MRMKVRTHHPAPSSSPSKGEEFAREVPSPPSPQEGEGEDGGFRNNDDTWSADFFTELLTPDASGYDVACQATLYAQEQR